jgi:ABC-type multidrug transport system fused ATPase/permease subunit
MRRCRRSHHRGLDRMLSACAPGRRQSSLPIGRIPVAPGETVALVGPSGGGKARSSACCRALWHHRRRRAVNGRDIRELKLHDRSKIALVTRNPSCS